MNFGGWTEDAIERYWSKVDVGAPDECWLWRDYVVKGGYGEFRLGSKVDGTRRQIGAHRASVELDIGEPIPEGLQVNHYCHVRGCVNPNHLYMGTQTDNMRDMNQANRRARGDAVASKGPDNPNASFTEEQVREIRRRYAEEDIRQVDLADEYGVTQTTISHLVIRRTYPEVA